MNNELSLRLALIANALFSTSSALVMLTWPELVGRWLGTQAPTVLRVVGAGLLMFAADLVHQASRKRIATWRALYASTGDFFWVVGTVALLALFPNPLSQMGKTVVLGVAAAVLAFGIWQILAITRAHRATGHEEYRHCLIVEVNAPADAMWQVVRDLGGIKSYMPSLKRSALLDGREPGVGAVRACEDHSGKQWSEECTQFNDDVRSFTVRFLSEAPNFPFPARKMRGGWEVSGSEIGSQVRVWWELIPKQKFLAPFILPLLAFQVDRDFPKIIKRMAAHAIGKSEELQRQGRGVVSHLLPKPC